MEQYPEPNSSCIRDLPKQHGIQTGDWVTITSRRAAITLQAIVVRTIRPDTVFIPYHWPGSRSANRLTHRTLDPRSKIPEFKVSACRIQKQRRGTRLMFGMEFYVDPSRCIGCQSCLEACEECETHRGVSMINFDFVDRQETIATAAYVCWHCEDPTCAQVCPADAIKKYEDGIVRLVAQAALHRLLELRAGMSLRHP